jgi:ABC-type Na+ efflux pump permease subunit
MMAVVLALCALAVYIVVMLSGGYSAEDKERAEKILTPVIACLLGYFSGSSRAKW